MANSILVVAISGKHTIDINGHPTRNEWFVLGLLILVLPVAAAVGWRVSRIRGVSIRAVVSRGIPCSWCLRGAFWAGRASGYIANLVLEGIVIVARVGTHRMRCWHPSLAGVCGRPRTNLAFVGALFVRALPVVLLTVLVFFDTYVWSMASTVSRGRLWLALLFLALIAIAFITSATVERVRPMLAGDRDSVDDDVRLTGTPFEKMPHPARPLRSRGPNASTWCSCSATSQVLQVGLVAIVAGLIFLVLGLILLSPELLAQWSRNGSSDGQILGMTLPVPQSLIQISMFLAAMTFMYVSARAVGDADYRSRFIDPLIDDLRLTLVARSRYRAAVPRAAS